VNSANATESEQLRFWNSSWGAVWHVRSFEDCPLMPVGAGRSFEDRHLMPVWTVHSFEDRHLMPVGAVRSFEDYPLFPVVPSAVFKIVP
jgi:hypothetical protein